MSERRGHKPWCCCEAEHSGFSFGIFLLIIGSFFLAQDQGWITPTISFWPIAILALGGFFVIRSADKANHT